PERRLRPPPGAALRRAPGAGRGPLDARGDHGRLPPDRPHRDQPHPARGREGMSSRQRLRGVLAAPVLAALGGILLWGLSGAPAFGDFHGAYGDLLNRIAVPQRHTTNVVTAIVFDYRGFDTMGEEFILFASVVGVVLLLRDIRKPAGSKDDAVQSDAIRLFGVLIVGVVVVVGLWL